MTLAAADLRAVVTPQRVLRRASPGQRAETLGLSYRRTVGKVVDLTIAGPGRPASLRRYFAAGDVRRGPMKRVASAKGEGTGSVRSIHAAIGIRF